VPYSKLNGSSDVTGGGCIDIHGFIFSAYNFLKKICLKKNETCWIFESANI
jgi:hypothetical protein